MPCLQGLELPHKHLVAVKNVIQAMLAEREAKKRAAAA
jgi:hypothetical protein